MNTTQDKIDAVRGAVVKRPPFCSGVVNLDNNSSKLFYERQDKTAGLLSLTSATTAQLEDLNRACLPATFQLDGRDVYHGPYIKARKLGVDHFATKIDLHALDIVKMVRKELLEGPNQNKPIEVELYELNIYDAGSFLKVHKDTPRSEKVFASLVISFPTPHQGGNLILRHDGEEYSFDPSNILSKAATPSAACVAFYSDVEHEIAPITSGYRLTLTYDLLYGEEKEENIDLSLGSSLAMVTRSIPEVSLLQAAIVNLLQDDHVLPDGGCFGFGFRYTYPAFTPQETDDDSDSPRSSLKDVLNQLRGSDALLKQVCDTLSLSVTAQVVIDTERDEPSLMLIPDLVDLSESQVESGWEEAVSDWTGGREVVDWESESAGDFNEKIMWVTPRTAFPTFRTTYIIADYKRPIVAGLQGDICLVVKVGPVGRRETAGLSASTSSSRATSVDF
ncbi:hypothetical protein BDN72DRAFT_775478 [Pluteus cervinus]|uniref:Uncharacterized protein n=1 Tax=Pluteus cervinus TaxID=181527 RepID=A0ACD3AD28_9AGAR|nr:hypothetical protein BDN72DRAFT_775478 [Pluteus cervinus]